MKQKKIDFGPENWKLTIPGQKGFLELHDALRSRIKKKWKRTVPFADELFDRFEKAKFLGFGKGASIYDSSLVMGNVQVGKGTWIGPFTILDGRGGLKIGSFCSISSGVHLYSHDTVEWALTGGRAKEYRKPTKIGNSCYIGAMTIVNRGVVIGDHSVIGANSFVKNSIPPFSIAAGNPAKILGRVTIVKNKAQFIYE